MAGVVPGDAMTNDPQRADRWTLPLLFAGVWLAFALSFWPPAAARVGSGYVCGLVGGGVIGFAFRHPYRALGFVPLTLTALFAMNLIGAVWGWTLMVAAVAGAAALCALISV